MTNLLIFCNKTAVGLHANLLLSQSFIVCPNCAQNHFGIATIDVVDAVQGFA
jgi:hypothetical protein